MTMIAVTRKWPDAHPREFLAMAVVLWVALYWLLAPTAPANLRIVERGASDRETVWTSRKTAPSRRR